MYSEKIISKRLNIKDRFTKTKGNLVATFNNIYDLEKFEENLDRLKCKYISTFHQECIKIGPKKGGDLEIVKTYKLYSKSFFELDKKK